jgi:hypothetical protein
MGSLRMNNINQHFIGITIFLFAFISFIEINNSYASELGVIDYRFRILPNVAIEPNSNLANGLISKLSHTSADKELIWEIVRKLEPDNATSFLCDYLDEYKKKNNFIDTTWGRGVFCLGMVQTDKAKEKLLTIWDEYDNALATGKLKIDLSSLRYNNIRPLFVIGDSLHFYLWDDSVRNWFENRIKELDSIKEPDVLALDQKSRLIERKQLITRLLTWDIIESVDEKPVITAERVTAFYPFTQTKVKNISKSAEKVIDWTGKLKHLNPELSLEEWKNIRKSEWEPAFDEVCGYLGKPLGMTIWGDYLKNSNRPLSNKHRLWLICLITFLDTIDDSTERSWSPSEDEDMFLQNAIEYINQIGEGFIRDMQMQGLFKISYFAPENTENKNIKKIREISEKFLDKNTRQRLSSNADMNMKTLKKTN